MFGKECEYVADGRKRDRALGDVHWKKTNTNQFLTIIHTLIIDFNCSVFVSKKKFDVALAVTVQNASQIIKVI